MITRRQMRRAQPDEATEETQTPATVRQIRVQPHATSNSIIAGARRCTAAMNTGGSSIPNLEQYTISSAVPSSLLSSSCSAPSSPTIRRDRLHHFLFLAILFLLVLGCFQASFQPASASKFAMTDPNKLLGPSCPPSTTNQTVRIGAFYCTSLSPSICLLPHNDLILGIWTNWVNNHLCGLLEDGTAVELVPLLISATAATAAEIRNVTLQALSLNVSYVILPSGSLWGPGMDLLEAAQIPAIAPLTATTTLYQCTAAAMLNNGQPTCKQPNTRRYQYAHSILSPAEKYLQGWVGLLQLKKCESLTIVSTFLATYSAIITGMLTAASDNHIPIVGDPKWQSVALSPGTNVVPNDVVESVVDGLKQLNADAVVILASDCRPWILRLQAVDYMPKSLATLLCTDQESVASTLGASLNYIVGPVQWDGSLSGSEYTETNSTTPYAMFFDESAVPEVEVDLIGMATGVDIQDTGAAVASPDSTDSSSNFISSPRQFVREYQRVLNITDGSVPGYDTAAILASVNMLHGAMYDVQSVNPLVVNSGLQLHFAPSFFGLLTTDRYGMNQQKQIALLQRDSSNQLHSIYPSFTATMDFIYPAPAWSDRVYTHRMFALGTSHRRNRSPECEM